MKRYNHARAEVNDVLEWLWDDVVEPVLDELGFKQKSNSPRVWWVGSGLLNILPIHAAGYHDCNPPKSALDCVVSSYTPTIQALSYARDRAIRSERATLKDNAILVAMPTTPGETPLPTL